MAKFRLSNDAIFTFIISALFSSLFVFTNIYDWDYVFTTLEVDLRSLVLEGKIPAWTYQMCAGSSREGDPQSYGLSPLMILPILFGSFWGAKALLFTSVLWGVHFLKKIIRLLNETISFAELQIFASAFLTGNYFLFHFSNGHLTFSSIFYAFPLLYLCFKILLQKEIFLREFFWLSFSLFLLMTGGFYQASIYFIFPLAVAFGLFLIFNFKTASRKDILKLVGFSLLPLVLSAYRWLPVLEYQKRYPRTLNFVEWHGFIDQILYFIIPIGPGGFLWKFRSTAFSAGEDSFFGSVIFFLLVLSFFYIKNLWKMVKEHRPQIKFAFFLILTGSLFSLGNKYAFAPFALLNQFFSGSIRVASRFNLLTYIGLFILLVEMMRTAPLSAKGRSLLTILFLAVSILSLGQHYSREDVRLSVFQMDQLNLLDPIYEDKMQLLHVTRMRGQRSSHMHIPTMLGMAVPNCYQPMSREVYFMAEDIGNQNATYNVHFLQVPEGTKPECHKNSYFTQNEIHIDKSCSSGTRILLNFIEPKTLSKNKIKRTDRGYFL